MTERRIYIDAYVWIEAVQGASDNARIALQLLDDPKTRAVLSDGVLLETLPKPRFHRRQDQVEMLEALFACAEKCTPESSAWMALALRLASEYDLSPMDALHAACALLAGVDEFVTLEKPGKPFFRVPQLRARSLYVEGEQA